MGGMLFKYHPKTLISVMHANIQIMLNCSLYKYMDLHIYMIVGIKC
jgi:hypothetical protein